MDFKAIILGNTIKNDYCFRSILFISGLGDTGFSKTVNNLKGLNEMSIVKLIAATSAIALLAAAPAYAGKTVSKSKNEKVSKKTEKAPKNVALDTWVDLAYVDTASDASENLSSTVLGTYADSAAAAGEVTDYTNVLASFSGATITTRANADFDLYFHFNCATIGSVIYPVFEASAGSTSNVDGVLGSLTLTMTQDNDQDIPALVLIHLDGEIDQDADSNIASLGYVNKSESTATNNSGLNVVVSDVSCTAGAGLGVVRFDLERVQSNTFTLGGKILPINGGVNLDTGIITAVTGDAPAGSYNLDVQIGAAVSSDSDTIASDLIADYIKY